MNNTQNDNYVRIYKDQIDIPEQLQQINQQEQELIKQQSKLLLHFDDFIEERVGFGRYQIITLSILMLIEFSDGAELVLTSFIAPLISYQYDADCFAIAFLTSAFYFGSSAGALMTGKIADVKGRRPAIIISTSCLFLLASMFFMVNSILTMAFLRFLYGFLYGFSLPLTTAIMSETLPFAMRGKGLVLVNFFVTLGKFYGCCIVYICLNSFTQGDWRLMILLSSLPTLFVFLGSLFILKESPRFLISTGRYEEGFTVLNAMLIANNCNPTYVSEQEKHALILWKEKTFGIELNEDHRLNGSVNQLLSREFRLITLRLWLCWFCQCAMYYGQLTILPFILQQSSNTFSNYIIAIIGEGPAILMSLYMIDTPNFGRKNSLVLFFSLASIFNFVTLLAGDVGLGLYSLITRFFLKQLLSLLYPITAEMYPTILRTIGFGWASGIGRFGAAIIPFMIFGLSKLWLYGPFLIFTIAGIAATISSFYLPYDTLGRKLDTTTKSENQKKPSQKTQIQLSYYQQTNKIQRKVKQEQEQKNMLLEKLNMQQKSKRGLQNQKQEQSQNQINDAQIINSQSNLEHVPKLPFNQQPKQQQQINSDASSEVHFNAEQEFNLIKYLSSIKRK